MLALGNLLFSRPVMPDSLWPHGLQHARPRCPSPTISRGLPKSTFVASVMLSSHLILWRPLLLLPLGGGNSKSAHRRRKWQTTPVHMSWEPHELYRRPRKLGWIKSRAPPPPPPFHLLHQTYSSFLFSTPDQEPSITTASPLPPTPCSIRQQVLSASPSNLDTIQQLLPSFTATANASIQATNISRELPGQSVWYGSHPCGPGSYSGHIDLSSRCKSDHVISPVLLPEASLAVASTPSPLGKVSGQETSFIRVQGYF